MIRFEEVHKIYPDGTVGVGGITLDVAEHSTTVLLGSSGSGKTTLMRMVNKMVTPTEGRVLLAGADVAEQPAVALRRSIGYVLQDGGLFPHRRVVDNIATVPVLDGVPKDQARKRALDLMDMVGLDRDLAQRFPSQLSGGQRQRVGVARALANDPKVLLMDEPFGALDPLVRADLQRELRELQQRLGTTILFVTHDVDEAFLLGDQVAVLRTGGTLAQVGTPEELLTSPADEFVADFVGADAGRRQLRAIDRDGTLLALSAIVAAAVLSVPLGRLAVGSRSIGGVVLSALALLYAVPSLPMLVVIPVILGIPVRSPLNMVIVLTLYGIAVLITQVAEAFRSLPRDVIEAANALGIDPWRRFWQVELPLAVPVLVAGLRVVAASTVSLVTVGALVGVQSLGTLFTDGFQRQLVESLLTGLGATLLLALVFDLIIVLAGRLLTPWLRRRKETKA